jgi:ubiquinone/menaquinone biosynthesis C-methylase UbiE
MNTARAPEKEGEQDPAAVLAYDRTADWPPFRVLRRMVLRRLERWPLRGVLMDAGCGPGHLALAIGRRFPDIKVIGLDNNDAMIAAARRHRQETPVENVSFQAGDVQRLPGEDASIDFIVSTLSLHHWPNAHQAIDEMHRVLKPGGRLLLMDLRRDCVRWFYCLLVVMQRVAVPAAIRRTNGPVGSFYASYTAGEIAGLLGSAPFRRVNIETASGWFFAAARKSYPAGY